MVPDQAERSRHSPPPRYQSWLTAALLSLLVIEPSFEENPFGLLSLIMLTNCIVLAGLYAVSWNKRRVAVGLLLALPSVITTWSFFFRQSFAIDMAQSLSLILFYVYTFITILQRLFRSKRVGIEELFGALNVYILIGLSWGLLYSVLEGFLPGAFAFGDLPSTPSTFIYYSFSTLGTLGIGDVHPVRPIARSLSIVEMLVGLFFVTVSFGKLVAIFRFEMASDHRRHIEKPRFERALTFLTQLPKWWLIGAVTGADLMTSLANGALQMPLFLDTWATSAGTILGGVWVGVLGGAAYNLIMAGFVWGHETWVWMLSSVLVAVITHHFCSRRWLDLSQPISLVGCGLAVALANTLLGIIIINLTGLPRNESTLAIHTKIFELTGNALAADFVQLASIESMDKIISLVIALIVVFAITELRGAQPRPDHSERPN